MQWITFLMLIIVDNVLQVASSNIGYMKSKGHSAALILDSPCKNLQKVWAEKRDKIPYIEEDLDMILLWNDEMEQAASALLRATLLAAGFNGKNINLYKRSPGDLFTKETMVVDVEITAQLQVRLSTRAATSIACTNATTWSFYQDADILRRCDFNMSQIKLQLYVHDQVMNQFQNTCVAEIITRSITANETSAQHVYVDQSRLLKMMDDTEQSFLFIDTYNKLYNNTDIVRLPLAHSTDCVSNVHSTVSLKYNSGRLPESFIVFSPSWSDLHRILHFSQAYHSEYPFQDAACQWALLETDQFLEWRLSAVLKPRPGYAIAVICQSETKEMYQEYVDMLSIIDGFIPLNSSTVLIDRENTILKLAYSDCSDIEKLLERSIEMFNEKVLAKTAGVILPESLVEPLASYAINLKVPLFKYDIKSRSQGESPAVRSVTGNAPRLVVALRYLLDQGDWIRLAVLSDSTSVAKAISAELRAPANHLTIREKNVTSHSNFTTVLEDLKDVNARVIFVNTEANIATSVLAAAVELKMTRNKNYVWIVREYDTADNATEAIKPYSVAFWWRGERGTDTWIENKDINKVDEVDTSTAKSIKEMIALRKWLEEKWSGRPWPKHAVPLLDALLTLREGIRRYRDSVYWTWPRVKNVNLFWNNVQKREIPSINQNLKYDNSGVVAPLVFVEQWNTEPRPRLLATWCGMEWRKSSDHPLVDERLSDGSFYCLVRSGDPFHPTCWDIPLGLFSATTVAVAVVLIIIAIRYSRRAIKAHDLRVKTEFAKRMLARKARVFEALGDNLIDRSALELLRQLGTGRFGRVHLGLLHQSGRKKPNVLVAAKALREEASSAEESEFLREASTLSTLEHEHIIRFLGVCVVDGPPLLLMEHAFFGDLLQYLQVRKCFVEGSIDAESISTGFQIDEKTHVSAQALTKLAQQAAAALAYLAQRGIVHRDLRASNCLVDERRRLKLADFGLARETGTVDGEYACRRGLFPVLWMAPESLATGVSSASSEVWSFGVLVFELVTLGRRPWDGLPPPTVVQHVLAGGRPRLPWDASAETRALARACWQRRPEARPSAARLAEWLSNRERALRPTLASELVDVDSQMYNNDTDELDFLTNETELINTQTK